MLKKRRFKINKIPKLKFGTIGLYCLYTFRFEYRYCLFLRKFLKKLLKRKKRKIKSILKRKTWIFVRPNYTLTRKSKHSRMGKGKGNFKRWCTIVYPGRVFIEHINVSIKTYHKYLTKVRAKLKLDIKYVNISHIFLKKTQFKNSAIQYNNNYDIIKVRKNLRVKQMITNMH